MVCVGEMIIEGQDVVNTAIKYVLTRDGETVDYRRTSGTGWDDDVNEGVLDSEIFYEIITLNKLSCNPRGIREFLGETRYLSYLWECVNNENRAKVVKKILSNLDLLELIACFSCDDSKKGLRKFLEE